MASTLNLGNTVNWVRPIIKGQPLDILNQEPAITAANNVLGLMLAPPCVWRTNRSTLQLAINKTKTDYQVSAPDFSFMEAKSIWYVDSQGKTFAMQGKVAVAIDMNFSKPKEIAPQYDNGNGVVTFRVKPLPDQNYTVFIDYQRKLVPLQGFGSTYFPIDDQFQHIFNLGFKAAAAELVNNAYAPIWQKEFVARLLSTQDGLDDQAKLIFLEQFEGLTSLLTKAAGRAQAAAGLQANQ